MAKQSKQERAKRYADGAKEGVRLAFLALTRMWVTIGEARARLVDLRRKGTEELELLTTRAGVVRDTLETLTSNTDELVGRLVAENTSSLGVFQSAQDRLEALEARSRAIEGVVRATAARLGLDLSKVELDASDPDARLEQAVQEANDAATGLTTEMEAVEQPTATDMTINARSSALTAEEAQELERR